MPLFIEHGLRLKSKVHAWLASTQQSAETGKENSDDIITHSLDV